MLQNSKYTALTSDNVNYSVIFNSRGLPSFHEVCLLFAEAKHVTHFDQSAFEFKNLGVTMLFMLVNSMVFPCECRV